MGNVCLAFGASHSPILFISPEKWLTRVHRNLNPDEGPKTFWLTEENVLRTKMQVSRCLDAYHEIQRLLKVVRPDVILIIGDDQGENFTHKLIPQLAIYTGRNAKGSFGLGLRVPAQQQEDTRVVDVSCDAELADLIIGSCLEEGIDLAFSRELPSADGLGHAHIWPLRYLTPELEIPIVPVFINAYFSPLPPATRCYAFGKAISKAISRSNKRVAVFASGGLSHYPNHLGEWGIAPYPIEKRWTIDETFDRHLLRELISGEGKKLAQIKDDELHESGNNESRNWIVLAGVIGQRKGRLLAYEPVYTVAIGLAAAAWE